MLTDAQKQKTLDIIPHAVAGIAVVLDAPVEELQQWVSSMLPSFVEQESLAEKSCDVVTERAAPLVEKSAAAGLEGQPSATPATTQRTLGANVSGAKRKGVTVGRDRQPINSTLKVKILAVLKKHPNWHAEKIAKHLGVPRSSVSGTASKCSIKLKSKRETGSRLIDKIRKSLSENPRLTARQIADDWGVTPAVVNTAAKENGVTIRRVMGPRATTSKPVAPRRPPMRLEPTARPTSQPSRGTKFYLRNDAGRYLHMGCEHMVDNKDYAWTGLNKQILATRKKFPLAKGLHEEIII